MKKEGETSDLAQNAPEARSDVGLALPCNGTIEETEPGRSSVRFAGPRRVLGDMGDHGLDESGAVAGEAERRMLRVAESLGSAQ